jgi:hypothetical protein
MSWLAHLIHSGIHTGIHAGIHYYTHEHIPSKVAKSLAKSAIENNGSVNLYWTIVNDTDYTLHLEFYSVEREGFWPGNGEVYVLNKRAEREYGLSCKYGETICYKAWNADSFFESPSWGDGENSSHVLLDDFERSSYSKRTRLHM